MIVTGTTRSMEYVEETGHINRSIFKVSEEMEALRQSNPNGKLGTTPTALGPPPAPQGQGLLAILVMVSVLIFILAYCCWGAPCCRSLCNRSCCRQSEQLQEAENHTEVPQCASTPTIILLPYGRMLVVDGAVFAQFQADTTGLDLLELGESVIRAQQGQLGTPNSFSSTPSILDIDSDVLSKDHGTPMSSIPPPTYESLFGNETQSWRLPPSYSDTLDLLVTVDDAGDNLDSMRESVV